MGGLIAFHSAQPNPMHLGIITRLFEESMIRGTHAFGMSFFRAAMRSTAKAFELEDLTRIIASMSWQAQPPTSLIGICRYANSGSFHDQYNNQPINRGGNSIACSGVIDQTDSVIWGEVHGATFNTENDAEIILAKLNRLGPDSFAECMRTWQSQFAAAFMDGQGALLLCRTTGEPLWCAETSDAMFFASTEDILRRAHKFKTIKPVEAMHAIEIGEFR